MARRVERNVRVERLLDHVVDSHVCSERDMSALCPGSTAFLLENSQRLNLETGKID